MRVLYISYPFDERHAPHQSMAALWLARHGAEVVFLGWGNEAPDRAWLASQERLEYRTVAKRGWISAFAFLRAAIALVRRVKPDCIYVQGAQNTPFALWLAAFHRGARLVYHTQDYLGPGEHRFYERCERRFARRADAVISNEPNRARFMASSYGLSRMPHVLRTALPSWWPVPARDARVRERLLAQAGLGAIGEDACLIAAGGAYAADRMSPQLLDAFARLPGHYALVFTSMGEGSARLAQLRARIGGAEWGRRVVALGELDFARLLECYAACDLGVLLYPNSGIGHYYQAPGRLTEYLRCGLAIVASNFPGFELLFCRHAIGATADPNDPASIAAALRSLGEMPAPERAARRARLVELALGELAYEAQAEAVIPQALPGMAR